MKHNAFMYNPFLQELNHDFGYSVYSLMIRAVGSTFFHVLFMKTSQGQSEEIPAREDRRALEQTLEYVEAKEHLSHFFRSLAFLRIHCLDEVCSQRIHHFGRKVHHGYFGRDWNEGLTKFRDEPLGKLKYREAADHPHAWKDFQSAMRNLEQQPIAARIMIKAMDPIHQRSIRPWLRSR